MCRGVESALRRAADIVAAQQDQEGASNGNGNGNSTGTNGNGTKAKSASMVAKVSKTSKTAAAADSNGSSSDGGARVRAATAGAHPTHHNQGNNGGLHGYGVAMASAELEDLWTSAAVPAAVSHVASGGRWERLTGLRGGVPAGSMEEGEGDREAGVQGGKGAVGMGGGFGGSVDGVAQREEEREAQ